MHAPTSPSALNLEAAVSRVMLLPDGEREIAARILRDLYGPQIDAVFDAPPIWRDDLVDGQGNPIEEPPDFDTFVTSKAFLGQKGFYPRQRAFLERGMNFSPCKLFARRKTIHTLIALWGKGSGKDFLSSLVLAFVVFVINAMADPWTYLNHAPGEPIDVMNIACTAEQANSVFFNKLKARLRTRCFSQFAPNIGKGAINFFRVSEEFTEPTLLLQLHSAHSKAASWEGKSLIFWVMDEADAFEDDEGNSNADACYLTLASSAGSRFGSRYIGLIISFRRVSDGFMDRMRERCDESPGQMVFDEGATWDIRPDKNRADPEIEMHYKADPEDAACKYENIAPPVVGGFFTQPARLDECCDYQRRPVARITENVTKQIHQTSGKHQKYIALLVEELQADPTKTYFMHGDPGHTDASFAICLCHIETNRAIARGRDADPEDSYEGDVLRDDQGSPMPARRVVYFNGSGREAGRANTDREGKHSLWLAPGTYSYAFYDRNGHLIRYEEGVTVEVGTTLLIQSADAEIDEETGLRAQEQTVFPVVEDLLLEWKPREGMPVDYNNVKEVLLHICGALNVQQVSFDKFNSAMLVQDLCSAGINAVDMNFSNALQMAMFRNLRQMVNAGMVSFLGDVPETVPGRALRQLKKLRNIGNTKVAPAEGEWKDLADARAAAVYFACTLADGITDLGSDGVTMWSPGMGGGPEAAAMARLMMEQRQKMVRGH